MIKIENTEVVGWEAAIRGMRNPRNSWDKSDSYNLYRPEYMKDHAPFNYQIGPKDLKLMHNLCTSGSDHRKFMRMIIVYADITAPLYWWKEFDTYKVGTVANSCSTMHTIADKEFTLDDFSHEHLSEEMELNLDDKCPGIFGAAQEFSGSSISIMQIICDVLNFYRQKFLETGDENYWWQMIQLLPSSYNQKRTIMLDYEVLANIYKSRHNHKLDEWRAHDNFHDNYADSSKSGLGLCDWIYGLPYSELITGEE